MGPFAAAAVALTVRDPLAAAAATAAAATAAATAVATSERQCFVSSPQLLPQFARAHYRERRMSHNVMVTRTTTTTTTTSAILLNTGYLKTLPGLLILLQVVVGAVVVGLLASYSTYWRSYDTVPILFLLLIATACLITTGCLLISCLLSISTATIIAKTLFDLVYHGVALFLYVASSVNLLVEVNKYSRSGYAGRDTLISAGALGAVNSVLYCVSTVLAFRNYRRA